MSLHSTNIEKSAPLKRVEKLYSKANEKFAKAVVLYPNASKVLYFDEAATEEPVTTAELEYLVTIGAAVVKDGTAICRFVTYDNNTAVAFSAAGAAVTYTGTAI